MKHILGIIIALAACGGSKTDDCDRLADKMAAIGGDKDKLAADCRKDVDKIKRDPMMKCVLDADSEKAVRACLKTGLDALKHDVEEDGPRRSEAEANRLADEAMKQAREATERVEKIERDLADLTKRFDEAVSQLQAAQNDADRAAANAKLQQLRAEKAEMERRVAEAKAAAARAERMKGVKISKECIDNPLAKGCN